jgi:hypothetical protein
MPEVVGPQFRIGKTARESVRRSRRAVRAHGSVFQFRFQSRNRFTLASNSRLFHVPAGDRHHPHRPQRTLARKRERMWVLGSSG